MNRRLEIALELSNPFSYDEYLETCKREQIEDVYDIRGYADRVGRLKVAMVKYPDLSPSDALKTFTRALHEEEKAQRPKVPISTKPKSSCCGGDKDKKKPNLGKRALSLAKASTEHFMNGMKHVPSSVFLQRLEKCKDCTSIRKGFVCVECGCYMGIKASWAEQKCELNKW